jgi:O-antigen/teichoic acid export membrane protein
MTDVDKTWHMHDQPSAAQLVWRVVVNTISLLTTDVLNKAATFVVYALVGRYCGARAFGQLSLGLTLLYTFQVFASAGLPTLITRDVAKFPRLAGSYCANAAVIVSGAFLINFVILVLLVLLSQYPRDTAEVILILGLGILPWSLATNIEAIFRAREQLHLLAFVAVPINVCRVGVSYFVLLRGGSVIDIAYVLLACQTAAMICEAAILLREIPIGDIRIAKKECADLRRRTWRFLGIDSLGAVLACTSTVLLSWFSSEVAVGLFGAAWQLLMPVRLVLLAIINSMFPMMCRRAAENNERLQQFTVMMIEIVILIAAPSSILLYFNAEQVIAFLYAHKDFSGAAPVLRIILPALLLQAIAGTFGQLLFSQHREHVTLQIVAIDVVLNVVIGVPLIYVFGLTGAAISVLVVNVLNAWMHFWATRHVFAKVAGRTSAWSTSLILHIVAACAAMATAEYVTGGVNFIVACAIAVLLYLIVLAGLLVWACRGANGLRERFLFPLQESGIGQN